jgi:raffinose/stachyose/melibiose transport system permease protein
MRGLLKARHNYTRPSGGVIFAYLVPGIIIYSFSVFLPVLFAIYYSFFDWSGGPKMEFAGLSNYIELIHDGIFWKSFGNNLYLVLVAIIGQIGIAFLLAVMLSLRVVKLKSLHTKLIFFPVTVSAVVVGFVWSMVYDYDYGLLNAILKVFGMKALPWLAQSDGIMTIVSIPIIWQYIGLYLIIIMAALTSIDREILEMAEIDGASNIQRARYIILPMIKKTLIVCIMLCIAGNMKVFDHIFVMTKGGPGRESTVMAMYAYQTSFLKYRMGYGAAISIGILILSLVIILVARGITESIGKEKEIT